ncbi:MAG TPA: DUF1343 domain-containing protein [Acholeplasma sp.]|nr:DUF1343 domain-containing protein [Acholeplasmatales bacterium]NLL89446.1 DUF1343 domain-containing protein [Bacillota bacterium]HHV33928.1 DUF1343 domain-containing protein [Acholeplasma sp.]
MFKYGIENLNKHLDLFKGKRVGLLTNPSGTDQNFRATVDILNEHTNLTALFSPEHGLRGNLQDGDVIHNYVDEETGIMVYSLYGQHRKPTKEMLEDVDIICYDIQDVGARFYTYIYSLAHTMEAAKEHGKKVVVFDRPNPVGPEVEGNILNLKYRSFIGYYEIPQRYGLTVGELAHLFNNEFGINCDLEVIKMSGYKRDSTWYDYNLPFILPSPNLPTVDSLFVYLATCIFEGTNVSEGRGTTRPFSIIGAPWFKSKELVEIFSKKIPHAKFKTLYFTPVSSKHKGVMCSGVEIYVTDYKKFEPVIAGMIMLKEIEKLHEEFSYNPPWTEFGNRMIDLNVGDDFIRENTLTIDEIKAKFAKDKKEFLKIKEKYHLYD